jgi:Bax protein
MKIVTYSILFLIVVLLTGCNQNEVQTIDKKVLKSKIGTIENQKMITKIEPPKEEIKKPKVVKKKKRKPPISVSKKKQRFNDILVPIATEVYIHLQKQFEDAKKYIANNTNQAFINNLKEFYEVKTDQELLEALKPHPISITLAQGAIESAWLTSRFTKLANNIFGVWSFRSNEPRIEATGSRGDKKIYLKKYKNLKAAVTDYYKNLAKNWAYEEFRKQRLLTDDPYVLVDHLKKYSEKREVYTNTLKRMIKYNNFDQYDIKKTP